jgi:hypothetical protein
VNYLQFSPEDYLELTCCCAALDLACCPPQKLKHFLVSSLPGPLAERIARLRPCEVRLIHEHFRDWRRPHSLSPEEMESLTEAFGGLVLLARFARPLRRALVEQLRVAAPDLGRKLGRLSLAQFQGLCEQVKWRLGRG